MIHPDDLIEILTTIIDNKDKDMFEYLDYIMELDSDLYRHGLSAINEDN